MRCVNLLAVKSGKRLVQHVGVKSAQPTIKEPAKTAVVIKLNARDGHVHFA